ncbi:MAG: hypothetical protein V3U30_02985 [Thermoplasmata archaeon]
MATHTVAITQSGAGESTFLGRLVEELLLQTRSLSVILDPNSDFRRVHEMRPADLWDRAVPDASRGRGQRPVDLLHQTLTFSLERARPDGRWGSLGPQVVYTAARRTVEGGRNLWTVPRASAPPGQEEG